jgi:dolichol-phosphate mannosyltransferase
MSYADVTVIIPTLNEGKNIGELVKIISSSYKGIKIIVADDGSRDDTAAIVKKFEKTNKNIKLLDRSAEKIKGLTASVVDAVKITKTQFLVVIDGDLQHPPEKIRAVIDKLRQGNDIVIGTRAKVLGKWPVQRKMMSLIATSIARIRLMSTVQDPMSGFFGVKSELFGKILTVKENKFEKKGYKVLFDLLKSIPSARTANVYYTFGERKAGESKIRTTHVMHFLRSLLR